MLSFLARVSRWFATKFGTALLIVVGIVGGASLWIFFRDRVDLEQVRQETLSTVTGQRTKLRAALADASRELEQVSGRIAAEQQRLQQAEKVIESLKAQQSTWDRYVGDREQQKINETRLASVTAQRDQILKELARLQDAFNHKTWTRDGLRMALGKLDVQVKEIEAQRSSFLAFVQRAWNQDVGAGVLTMPLKWWVIVGVGLYLAGPSLGKLLMFYVVAPIASGGKPVRLAGSAPGLPVVGSSQPAVELDIGEGERLWIKESFLQASDEGVARATRYVLDWRVPFTCLATGLIELIQLTSTRGTARVTLSNQRDPHSELAIVTVPENTSLVLRPSFLAGIAQRENTRLKLRRHWQLFRWHAWVTLQFRYFEFIGPCRLVLAGRRGVRVENLADRQGFEVPARRINQDATIGFTPNLDYRPVRAETFWSYYRGMNPLFDDLFAGRGLFVCQQVAAEGEARQARTFWSALRAALLKVFGL